MFYDIIIIGSGPGGYVAAIRASQLGMKTAIVEHAELGGICLNWGCIPTKALLKSAQVFEYLKHASDYGIKVNGSEIDFATVIKRSRDVANGMSKGVGFLMKKNKIDVIKGFGKVNTEKKVEVKNDAGETTIYNSKNIIIAVGAHARQLPNIPFTEGKIIGYREAMTLPNLPKSMVVVGSGAIGSEFAYFYSAMGTKVTLVEFLPAVVPLEDEDISKQLERSFKRMGMTVMTSSEVISVDTKDICKVKIKTPKGEQTVECDIVFSAVGIAANLSNIGLEEVGIATDKGKILTNQYYQTNIPGYYAIGDCVGGQALAHVASAEGIICVEKIAGHNPEPLNYDNIPCCTYTLPEIASVGYTEKQAKEKGFEIKAGKFPFSASGKASAAGHRDGFVKIIFDAKDEKILGAHMIGYNVTEMIAEIVVARKLKTTGNEILRSVHPHPTMSEAIMEATANAYGEAIHL
ncbi:MAG: dihydrolipoyl dehydrogenase [Bacteroidota bacterium]